MAQNTRKRLCIFKFRFSGNLIILCLFFSISVMKSPISFLFAFFREASPGYSKRSISASVCSILNSIIYFFRIVLSISTPSPLRSGTSTFPSAMLTGSIFFQIPHHPNCRIGMIRMIPVHKNSRIRTCTVSERLIKRQMQSRMVSETALDTGLFILYNIF